jgi:integrase
MSGHIQKRGKNSWRLKLELGIDANGKRRIAYQTFRGSKREAEVKLAQLVTENAKGVYVDTTKLTLGDFIEKWLTDWAAGHVSPATFQGYENKLRKHVVQRIGHLPLQRVRAIEVNDLYATLLKEGLAARTVGNVHRALRRALGHAHKWNLTQQNVAALVSPPRAAPVELEILDPTQVTVLLQKLAGHSLYPLTVLALASGMRRGELLALRWRDVDLDKAVLRVERSLEQTIKGGLRFKDPKTRHSRRSITLPTTAVTVLGAHRKAQQERRLQLGQGKAGADALVFTTWDGEPQSPNGLSKEWSRALKRAGLPPATLHSCRHTHVSCLIAAGHDVLAVSRRLGHGSPTITLNVYGHLFPNMDDKAAVAVEAIFSGANPVPIRG